MTNAKEELLKFLQKNQKDKTEIKKAWFRIENWRSDEFEEKSERLNGDIDVFIEKLNFLYDSGYGGQNLYGQILFNDNTVAIRGEYDGSEWWEYVVYKEESED